MGSNFSDIKEMIDDKTKDKEAFKEWMKSHVSNTECKEFYNEGHIEDAWDYQQEKIEALFKIINDKDRTADVLFSDNTALEAKVEKLKVGLEQIGKYETCWTCKYYIGSTDKYCNPVGHCDVNRSQFVPNEKSKLLALETLKEVFGE